MATVVYARRLMGTDFEIKFDAVQDDLAQSLFAFGDALESELSAYREQSTVGRLNGSAVGTWIEMPEHTRTLVRLSRHFEEKTQGLFCVARAPFDAAFEVDGHRIRKKVEGAKLDFGAIGKGYTLDLWAGVLAREGVDLFLLSAGGSSVIARGEWKCGWAIGRNVQGDFVGLGVSRRAPSVSSGVWALGVSGIFEKGEHVWKRQSAVSSLVVSPRATDADALSTAVLAGAVLEDVPYAWLDDRGELFWNSEFATGFELSRGLAT